MSEDEVTPTARNALAMRLAIGVSQGLVLYALDRWRAELIPTVYGALIMTACLVPIAALGALGVARARTAYGWIAGAALVTLVIGGYAAYVAPPAGPYSPWVPPAAAFFAAVTLFILHHLILPADAEGRWRASFERYFDEGWKDAVRLALAVAFVGALWLLLALGAALFNLIGLDFLEKLITKPWFAFPATTTFFAIAVHITDVRVGLVRGARTLVLTLGSWLLPVLTLIAVGFVVALPFTGLKPLLATKTSSGVMLAVCAALIVLINATYQDGERPGFPPSVLRWAARIAAVVLAPLTLVAAYGIFVRIGQHGLSPERIYATACVLVAACYAGGYVWAAATRGPWMKRLETTNWITAQVVVVLLLLIFSPLFDPSRVSVASQVHRLESGRVTAKAFDYDFLRFRSGRWGEAALKRLANSPKAEVRALASAQVKRGRPWETPVLSRSERMAIMQAVGQPLPQTFLDQTWPLGEDPASMCQEQYRGSALPGCEAIVADMDGAPGPEVVLFGANAAQVYGERDGRWKQIGYLQGGACPGDREAVQAGRARIAAATVQGVEIDGRRMTFVPQQTCPQTAKAKGAPTNDVTDVAIVRPVPPPPLRPAVVRSR